MFSDSENNYQNEFDYFLNLILLFNKDKNGLINDNSNNNMMFLNDNNEYTSLQNQKADLPIIKCLDEQEPTIKCLDEQDTKWKTLKENNNFLLPHAQAKPDIDIKDENKNCFSLEEIKDILKNNQICEKLKKNKIIEDAEYKLFNKKRKRENDNEKKNENNDLNIIIEDKEEDVKKSKRGRRMNDEDNKNKSKIEHNKYSEDNIIKKIKAKILCYSLLFLNNVLKSTIKDKVKLYKLDYKYANQLKKGIDLDYLKMSLKDLYSMNVSPKFRSIRYDFNKITINNIIENKVIVQDYSTIKFALDLKFEKWMELFTYKKNINKIIKDYEGFENVNIEIIKKSFIGVEELLKEILEKNGQKYCSIFSFLLYNYEKWFSIRKGRDLKNKNENDIQLNN